jgi:DNA-binding NtrC family response regulator
VKDAIRKLFPSRHTPTADARTILIVDDDDGMRDSLKDVLEGEGYETLLAATKGEAVAAAEKFQPKVALVDLKLPDGTGTALLAELKQVVPACLCILITAYADVDSAIQALEKGAFYYLRKPVKPPELVELVDLAFETIRIKDQQAQTEQALRERNEELEAIVARLKSLNE